MSPLNVPPYIPPWPGRDPLRYWIAPEMHQFWLEIQTAMLTFSREPVWLKFNEVGDPGMTRSIDLRLEPLVGLLGLAMYPPPLIQEPQAGDVTLNREAFIQPEFRPLLLPTLIHELFHALGFGDFYKMGSCRCPHIEEGRINLSADDRASLLTIYGV